MNIQPDIFIPLLIFLWGAMLFAGIAGAMELSQRNWRVSLRMLLAITTVVAIMLGLTAYAIRQFSMATY